jgi:hypothetical protein
MGILSQSNRIESGRHSKLYYGLKDFGSEVWYARGKILGILIFLGLWYLAWTHYSEITNAITQMQNDKQKQIDNDIKIDNTVRTSTDCYTLKQTLLTLVSYGANSDSWIPNQYDSDLKIGKERYANLGCKA